MYNALVDDQLTNLDGDEYSAENILINLWIQTLKPYIDFIDNWIMTGELIDKYNEFALKKVKEQEIESFWHNSFTVNLSVLDSSSTIKPSSSPFKTTTKGNIFIKNFARPTGLA